MPSGRGSLSAGPLHACTPLPGTTRRTSLRREDLDQRFPGLLDSVLNAAGV